MNEETQIERQPLFQGSPLDFITRFDSHLFKGQANLHRWQIEQLEEFGDAKPSISDPYRLALVAANSSGKDKYVIAPFCIWFILSRLDAICVVTSSSAQQLDKQTERYLRQLSYAFNAEIGREAIRVIKRSIVCVETGSEIMCFATDEPGKAEGYHPTTPVSDMAIIMNEAKSIPDEIFEALLRCSGYKWWLEISSPGSPNGNFYRSWIEERGFYHKRRVTSMDCPHISKQEIEFDKEKYGGEDKAPFRSKHLALFTSLDQQVVIGRELLEKWIHSPPEIFEGPLRAGFDIGAGGDESGVAIMKGNTLVHLETWISRDTMYNAERAVKILRDTFGVPNTRVNADDNNIGRGVIDIMRDVHNYQPNRFLAQWAAINKKDFLNRGAEIWWNFARLYEKGLIRLSPTKSTPDKTLIDQLSSRRYLQPGGGKIRLMSKPAMKAEGMHSPDRADALVLAFVGVTEADLTSNSSEPNQGGKSRSVTSTNSLIQLKPGKLINPSGGVFNQQYPHEQPQQEAKTGFLGHPGLLLHKLRKMSRL